VPEKKLVTIEDREVRLTPLENRLLAYFLRRANEVCTIEELLTDIWGAGKTRSVVEKGVSRLREKIEADPKRPRYLLSAWGEGYLLRTAVVANEQ
jgi:two-component system alkaline phosphatase synthesis response regulator PhoP